MMRDADFGIVRLRAYGTYDFRVVDVKKFLKEVAGTDDHFRLDEFNDTMRSRIVSVFSDALATAKVPALDVAARYGELGDALLPVINPVLGEKYGLAMTSFIVENVSVPPEVEQAIDKRSSMAAVGNLNDYVKFQMAQGMEKGGAGAGGMAAEMAVGMAMAQQMMNQTGGLMAQSTPGIAAPAPAAARCGGRARAAHAGAGGAGAGRRRGRRHGEPRGRRPQGQADRNPVARHPGGGRRLPRIMTPGFVPGRRGALRAAAAVAVGALAPALAAQDARAFEAQAAARKWLALTDRDDAGAAGRPPTRSSGRRCPLERWTDALKQVRGPLGAFDQRAVMSTRFTKTLKDFPAGDYAIVVFRSSFAKKPVSQETVTLDRDSGGTWRVVGYAIT